MLTSDFDFELPAELIAQVPAPGRDQSRLLVLHRADGRLEHRDFPALVDYLRPGEMLVLNNSKVIPARLRGFNGQTGGEFEVLLLEENGTNDWWVMVRPGKRARLGTRIQFRDRAGRLAGIDGVVLEKNSEGHCRLGFAGAGDLVEALEGIGEVPLPPYIKRARGSDLAADLGRYQTVYAQHAGSVAAPTAGLHFTEELLADLRGKGVVVCFVTLHVGLGTFAPVKARHVEEHRMHEERYDIPSAAAAAVNAAKADDRRVLAVGTTSLRVLESAAAPPNGRLAPEAGRTHKFIFPPHRFAVVDGLLTNFHLPRSTLLMLASAFAAPGETRAGRELLLGAYAEAVRRRYRFFSYGDAMLII